VWERVVYLALFVADGTEPLFLQMKEARRSVLESPGGKSRFAHQGFRVVYGQRIMQAASDIFLGWFRSAHGHDFYVRQFRDMKGTVPVDAIKARALTDYAGILGRLLAKGHARTSGASMIAGYVGASDRLDAAMSRFARAYADQVEADHEALVRAVAQGVLPSEAAGS